MAGTLYPNYRPRGVRKEWDHCSVGPEGAALWLSKYGVPTSWGVPVDVVGWFDMDTGAVRLLVADYANHKRATLRVGSRSFSVKTEAIPDRAALAEHQP